MKFLKILPFLLAFLICACQPKPIQVSYDSYKISNIRKNEKLNQLLTPYRDTLSQTMNVVIGFSINGLTKKQPESVLGNFMTDAFKSMAAQKFNTSIDAAFVNFGGIRSYLPKGDITVGNIFELMPFDNLIVLQKLTGLQLKEFLNKACEKGGWPVSEGFKYSIKDKKLAIAYLEGKEIEDNKIYTVANSDYLANGGDNCDMLKKIPKQNINYLMRDALIEYIKQLTAEYKTVDSKTENRVVYAK
jgi:2',3'-cyclic-nucleotide 2'-phosphodiesterase (5'-nucleotidase family)